MVNILYYSIQVFVNMLGNQSILHNYVDGRW